MKLRFNNNQIKAACIDDNYDFEPEFESGDDQAIVNIDQLPTDELEFLQYVDGIVSLKDQADIDAIEQQREKNAALSASDMDFIRVSEDLIDTLIDKNIILLADLPAGAQEKINNRKDLRQK